MFRGLPKGEADMIILLDIYTDVYYVLVSWISLHGLRKLACDGWMLSKW